MPDDSLDALLIGIDAGAPDIFDRLFEEGRTPALEEICRTGAYAPLRSQVPPWTPSAWPSIYTGVNPGEHGVTGFVGYNGYDWHVVNYDQVDAHGLWDILDYHGHSSVIVNVPVTHPPPTFDGAIVPGFIGPEDPECHPDGLLEELRAEIGEYRVYPNYTRGTDELTDPEKMDEYERLTRMRGRAFRYLCAEYEPTFGFIQFQKTDTVFHEFNGDESKVNRVYEAVDEEIASIIETYQPRQIFLVSDHGMGQYGPYEFSVNEYLRQQGYVEATNSGKGMPSWTPIRNELREGKDVETWDPSRTERLAAGAAKFGFTARRARIVLEKLGILGPVKRVVPSNVARTANLQVDFEQSTAYMRARTEFGIRINLEGREPNGVVPRREYDRVRAELIKDLRAVETPDGEPVFEEVVPREEHFSGKHAENAVDLVTIPTDMNVFLTEQLDGSLFSKPAQSWDHKIDGIFAAAGEGLETDVPIEDADLLDVAPTILASLGIPRSERMDGSVLPIVDDPGYTAYPSYETGARGAEDADEQVKERLAGLGYLS